MIIENELKFNKVTLYSKIRTQIMMIEEVALLSI